MQLALLMFRGQAIVPAIIAYGVVQELVAPEPHAVFRQEDPQVSLCIKPPDHYRLTLLP
jgi:hypothetical protein